MTQTEQKIHELLKKGAQEVNQQIENIIRSEISSRGLKVAGFSTKVEYNLEFGVPLELTVGENPILSGQPDGKETMSAIQKCSGVEDQILRMMLSGN